MKLCLDFSLFLAGSCSYRGCRGSFSCLSFSSWDETARLICGGAIPHNKYRSSTLVGLSHPEMALQAAFRTGDQRRSVHVAVPVRFITCESFYHTTLRLLLNRGY